MSKSNATIKSIIAPSIPCFAAFLPDPDNDIDWKISPIVCWSLVSFSNDPDEVIGQIIADDAVFEVTYVDEEDGFGKFLGYFFSESDAKAAIRSSVSEEEEEEEEEEAEEEEEEEEDEEEEE